MSLINSITKIVGLLQVVEILNRVSLEGPLLTPSGPHHPH